MCWCVNEISGLIHFLPFIDEQKPAKKQAGRQTDKTVYYFSITFRVEFDEERERQRECRDGKISERKGKQKRNEMKKKRKNHFHCLFF